MYFLNKHRSQIIIIYADDLSWNQISCYGYTKIKKPNIDALPALYDKPVSNPDIFATPVPVANVTVPADRIYDGL